jgi:hypothetical protein
VTGELACRCSPSTIAVPPLHCTARRSTWCEVWLRG